MANSQAEIHNVLALIEDARLPHPGALLLTSFVKEALNPVVAARYVERRLMSGDGASMASDWLFIAQSLATNGQAPPPPDATIQRAIVRRDGGRCCITGKKGDVLDPLEVVPVLPVPSGWARSEVHISEILGAFFGPPYRDWWLSYVRDPTILKPYHNHWLVRRSAAAAFAEGRLRLDRMQPSMVEYEIKHVLIGPERPFEVDALYPLLGDHSRSHLEKVDPRLIGTHARLSTSIRLLHVGKEMGWNLTSLSPKSAAGSRAKALTTRPWVGASVSSSITSTLTSAFLAVWTWLPGPVRVAAYELLRKLGERCYGQPEIFASVQRLPFGLYLKYHGENSMYHNEFTSLQMVRERTSVPVPRPLDVVSKPKRKAEEAFLPGGYLLMTRVPGYPLSTCRDLLSDSDCQEIALQMKDYVAQLRSIPKEVNAEYAICNTLGGAIRDHRIRGSTPVGPFRDEAAFSQILRFSDDPHRRGHRIVFTHADLNPRNILVDRLRLADGCYGWRVTGIVDWETAGFLPEYWDYTKAMFEGFRWPLRYNDIVRDVFSEFGDYSGEMDVEKRSWESGDAV